MIVQLLALAALFSADPAVPLASEEEIDAFVASIPPSDAQAKLGEPFGQERLERLVKLNPGREDEVQSIHAVNEQCKETSKERAVTYVLRSSARTLGSDKLARLTAFYQGSDHDLFSGLSQQPESNLSQTERAELKRIRATYPLDDFFQSMKHAEKWMWSEDGLLGALIKCNEVLDGELTRRGLRS